MPVVQFGTVLLVSSTFLEDVRSLRGQAVNPWVRVEPAAGTQTLLSVLS